VYLDNALTVIATQMDSSVMVLLALRVILAFLQLAIMDSASVAMIYKSVSTVILPNVVWTQIVFQLHVLMGSVLTAITTLKENTVMDMSVMLTVIA
jgi:hypothetical protein